MLTQLAFNVSRALEMVVPQPGDYLKWPEDKITALLVRLWPGTMSSKRHPLSDYQHPDRLQPVTMAKDAISTADMDMIQRQFDHERAIMADALYNTPTYSDMVRGYQNAEARLMHAYSLHGELYSHPSEYTIVPTVCRIYGRTLTIDMMYGYHELMPLLQHPPENWPSGVVDSLRRQFRLDILWYGITAL